MNANLIFDAFISASDSFHKQQEIKDLKKQNSNLKSQCGSCSLWMTKQCKREAQKMVTCNDMICSDFSINKWTVDLITNNELTINTLSQ